MKKLNLLYGFIFGLLLLGSSQKTHAQCSDIASNYKSYLLTHSLSLDPIEGKWVVSRTVKIYVNNRVVRLYKEGGSQSWLIVKKENYFVVCNEKLDAYKATVSFIKNKKKVLSYYFNLTYSDDLSSIVALSDLQKNVMKFSYFECKTKLKEFVKEQSSENVRVEYEYEMEKENTYVAKISQEVPRVKNFVIKKVKDYFNL